MEAGPRNRAQQPDREGTGTAAYDDPAASHRTDPTDGHPAPVGRPPALGDPTILDAPGTAALDDSDSPDADRPAPEGGESFRELRPPRRLRLWQLAPVVALGTLGSLMFAFPLAFEFGGDGGAVIAMLGLLLCCCAAGGGMMAARRVGQTWPGLPARGSGRRADWRVVLVYTAVVGVLAALAIWRVARLR
ncbi:hypothetical protein [Streptomyces pinistramenti]|uniref:hypothetical protein n=1 Tax=Streptomyces pinistramenti TaxID=2884812 RepID=UPI001D08C72E|nr:hypothetical protein [Streptomyces pinistramenti]MCB5910529.1 hypothetical protein [Streptomyces pinistramenti]